MTKKLLIIFMLATAVAFAGDSANGISDFRKVDDGLYRGAAPEEKGLEHLKDIGIKTVIDLRGGRASVRKEARLARKLGIKYVNIPLNPIYGLPGTEEIKTFLKITKDPQNRPVFVHCHNGIHRTGRMIKVYNEKKD